MLHELESKTNSSKKQKLELIDCKYIEIQPKNYVHFVCTPYQTSAVLKITINDQAHNLSTFNFSIKATNKTDYIVTDPTGILMAKQSLLIYFYMKQSVSLNKILKDRFLLQIYEKYGNSTQKLILCKKLTIKIQSGLQLKCPEINVQNNSNIKNVSHTMTQMLSGYVSASELPKENESIYWQSTKLKSSSNIKSTQQLTSLQTARSLLKKSIKLPISLSKKNIHVKNQQKIYKSDKFITDQNKSLTISENSIQKSETSMKKIIEGFSCDPTILPKLFILEQSLKTQLNHQIQQIQKKRRKILILQNENKSIQARKRFRKYATIIAVLFWFFIGMFIKSFNIHEKITNAFHQTKIELSTLTNPQIKEKIQPIFDSPNSLV